MILKEIQRLTPPKSSCLRANDFGFNKFHRVTSVEKLRFALLLNKFYKVTPFEKKQIGAFCHVTRLPLLKSNDMGYFSINFEGLRRLKSNDLG